MVKEKISTTLLTKLVLSMAYKVIITPPAKRRLDMYVHYTLETLQNRQAAKAILADAKAAAKKLGTVATSLQICDSPILAKYEYRKIGFEKHDFMMVYRINEGQIIVDGMFHELQDYEGILTNELHLE